MTTSRPMMIVCVSGAAAMLILLVLVKHSSQTKSMLKAVEKIVVELCVKMDEAAAGDVTVNTLTVFNKLCRSQFNNHSVVRHTERVGKRQVKTKRHVTSLCHPHRREKGEVCGLQGFSH